MVAFVAGAVVAFGVFAHSTAHRYRNLNRKVDETHVDRARRVLSSVAWHRVVAMIALGGLLAGLLWHGLDDTVSRWLA